VTYIDEGNKLSVPFYQGLLAEIEAQGDAEGALSRIEEALALAGETDAMGPATRVWAPSLLSREPMERPMKRNDLSRSLAAFDQASTLVAVVELSLANWLVAGLVPHLTRQPIKKLRSDPDALLGLLLRWRDQATKAGGGIKGNQQRCCRDRDVAEAAARSENRHLIYRTGWHRASSFRTIRNSLIRHLPRSLSLRRTLRHARHSNIDCVTRLPMGWRPKRACA
jgi:hypothetical protein